MEKDMTKKYQFFLLVFVLLISELMAQNVIKTIPAQNESVLPENPVIEIFFDHEMDQSSFSTNSIIVRSSYNGIYKNLTIFYDPPAKKATITINKNYFPGEKITVTLTGIIKDIFGNNLIPYTFSFYVKINGNCGTFFKSDTTHYRKYFNNYSPIRNIATGDFNKDGLIDIIYSNYSRVRSLLNTGDGNFGKGDDKFITYDIFRMYKGDFNNDGYLDLLLNDNSYSSTFFLLVNKQDGTFNIPLKKLISDNYGNLINNISNFALSDFDSDGDLDLIAIEALYSQSNFYYIENKGSMNFSLGQSFEINRDISDITVDDYDNDGDMDIALCSRGDYNIRILLNDGKGSFNLVGDYTFEGLNPGTWKIMSADFDNDGDVDILAMGEEAIIGDFFLILKNDGNGNFELFEKVRGSFFASHELVDWDADGDLDLITKYDGALYFYNNSDAGHFTPVGGFFFSNSNHPVTSGDLDSDNDQDVIFEQGGHIVVLWNQEKQSRIWIDTSSIYFPQTQLMYQNEENLVIKNIGTDTLYAKLTIKNNKNIFNLDKDSISVPQGDSAIVKITFIPQKITTYKDSLIIQSNDPRKPYFTIYLEGKSTLSVSHSSPPKNGFLLTPDGKIELLFSDAVLEDSLNEKNLYLTGSFSGHVALSQTLDPLQEKD
jgi:hypothetical protein